jgi:hypothetical protein
MPLCSHCNKRKISLIPFTCKCNDMLKLCSKCRLPEDHNCKFDFMKVERAKLEKDNQKVIGIKVEPM